MSAAATAAGALAFRGLLKANDLDVRHQGRECPHCSERFSHENFEFHLFIAHKRTEAKS
jgi:hypothetical protein